MRHPEDKSFESFDGVAENEPAFLAMHPWVVYIGRRIEGFFSNYKMASKMCAARWRYQEIGRESSLMSRHIVHAPTEEIYEFAPLSGTFEPAEEPAEEEEEQALPDDEREWLD